MDLVSALKELVEAPGVSGREEAVLNAARPLLSPLADAVYEDALGNLIVEKHGTQDLPPVMLATHADEIGFLVTEITENGFLRVDRLGGIDVRNIQGQEVTVHGREDLRGVIGTMPPHLTKPAERRQAVPVEDLYVDVGLEAAALNEAVRPGDSITFHAPLELLRGERLTAKALDNRASIAALLVCLQRLKAREHGAPVLGVLTAQEEVGVRGAATAAYGLEPAVGLAVDVGFGDQPGVEKADKISLGKGPAITMGPNIHPQVRQRLKELAKEHFLPYQEEVSPGQTGTDARAIQLSREGIPTGLLSIPLRYMHSPVEVVDLGDIRATGELLAHFCASLDDAWLATIQGGPVTEP